MPDDDSSIQMTDTDFAEVKSDTFPGKNREGGSGFVAEMTEDNDDLFVSDRCQIDGSLRTKIPFNDAAIIDFQALFVKEGNLEM